MMPILVNCLQGRNALPERKWKLPNAVGWFADMVRLNLLGRCMLVLIHAGLSGIYHSYNSAFRLPSLANCDWKQHE
jgi:hypothetical protein